MSKKAQLVSLIIVTVAVIGYFFTKSNSKTTEDIILAPQAEAYGSGHLPVDVIIAKGQFLANEIRTTGTLLASEKTALFSETNGKVTHIYFQEGQFVQKGTLLIKLNADDLIAQLERIKIEKSFADKTLDRQKQLFDKGGISREQFDQAQNSVNVLQAQIDETVAKIEKTEVRAPFDGVIGLRQISPGAYLTPTIQTASIQNINELNLEFSIPEKYFNVVKTGNDIKFSVSNSDKVYTATIYAIESQIDINTRTVVMRARFNNREDHLLPGLFAYINYAIESFDNTILVPSQSIVPELKGQKVYLYKNGFVDERIVDIGLRTSTDVQITQGVQAGDTVITTGILQVRKGLPVQVRSILK